MKKPTTKCNSIPKLITTLIIGLMISVILLISLCAYSSSKALDTNGAAESTTRPTAHASRPSATESIQTAPEASELEWQPDPADVEAIAKTLWGECRGVPYTSHKAAVVWCILNRVDEGGYFGSTIIEVISKPNQFIGYSPNHPVIDELKEIAEDVLIRWHAEKDGEQNVGRVLPKGYCYFVGDGELNYFTNVWKSKNYWDWSLPNPYES